MELVVHSPLLETQNSPEKRKAGRVQRACFNCRRRKQGCEEERPCKRCIEKGIECVEVEVKRKRGRFKLKENDSPMEDDSGSMDEQIKTQAMAVVVDTSSSSDDEGLDSGDGISLENCQNNEPVFLPVPHQRMMAQEGSAFGQKTIGMSLAHLLPFIINATCSVSTRGMELFFADECIEPEMMHIFTSEFPFCNASKSNHRIDDPECNEHGERLKDELMDFWHGILHQLQFDDNLRQEFRSVKQKWKDILKCLRSLEWHKVQSYLQQMEVTDKSHLQESPAFVFWSSGGRIHHANESFCKLVGYHIEELRVQANGDENIGAHSLFHPEETVHILKRQLDATQYPHHPSFYLRTRLVSKFQQEIPVSAFVTNLRDSLGVSLTVAHFAAM